MTEFEIQILADNAQMIANQQEIMIMLLCSSALLLILFVLHWW